MMFIFISLSLSLIIMGASFFLSKKTLSDKEKSSPFECGFDPYMLSRNPFSLRFFKIAIIFLIFDIEIVLILPLPLMNHSMSAMFFWSSLMVLTIILFGLLYEWEQGSLNWLM